MGAITGLPWAAQITEVKALLALMRGEQQGAIARFHLGQLVDQLDELAREFKTRLGTASRTQVTHDELRARDTVGQQHLLEAVAMVLGLHPKATKADSRQRAALLGPMLLQAEQIRAARAQRRPPTDIDPSPAPQDINPPPAPQDGDAPA